MTFSAFDVVVVPFPFTDRLAAKRRPALVVSTLDFNRQHAQSILAMITSAQQSDWPSDVILCDWGQAGLNVPCRVRMKLFTLDQSIVERRLGALATVDRAAVKSALSKAID